MAYISSNGTVGGPKSIWRTITDFFSGVVNFFALFVSAVTNPPQQIAAGQGTYSSRSTPSSSAGNGGGNRSGGNRLGRGSNIRGMKNIPGAAEARMGGG
mmetsp:Transcript_25077/g.70344  ORF Transcript_25077/g.70344 Transcript_25077/m.70344 type:complete len:99 (+) Transcript_25077:121-417(+)|eukprot:CAMPEP_0119570874 /NCGR_PEP_ID=MMETSP1352-20130426/43836_1 /TAXON_ID=265584 /ORGANISM="Stauroneis constricta, Strain CCMP1120" /LENGTH=98 /DNA_ID=CAMNT_0007620551 /DNA_START=509 /DNA_END=805 /DNA_ORIENTATION=-